MRWLALLALCAVAYLAYLDMGHAMAQGKLWVRPIILKGEIDALSWVRENTPERTVFVTDIVAGEMIMGYTLREGVLGGDWAVIPNVLKRMSDVQYGIYNSSDADAACAMAKEYGAKYVWVPERDIFAGYEWNWHSDVFNDARRFRRVFGNDDVTIYEVM
ncbi:Uncharacterised protein [Candidatus Norongarragalina meridionalis]|nr:Uncharacterised protein [Candidatus Norongarragalina meridionalis]